MKKIAFHAYCFSFRGSEVALFDYAFYNVHYLKNQSIIVAPKIRKDNEGVVEKFEKEFPIFYYDDINDLENICQKEKVDALYTIKYGKDDKVVLKNIPTWVHCVFTSGYEHGTIYAGVSDSVSICNSTHKYPVVNHIVYLPDLSSDYRKELNIPSDAIVFGRHGGVDTFNIPFVRDSILKFLEKRPDVWFLFAVRPMVFNGIEHPRIIYIDHFTDNRIKRKFINTCDAMIHACYLGESFGLSVLEFSFCGKPVITWNGGYLHKQHLENLGDKAILYNDENEITNIFENFKKPTKDDQKKYLINNFTVENVMNQFNNIFIKTLKNA